MSLTNTVWIQTIVQGRLWEVSLTEALLQAHKVTAIHGRTPLERVAIFRLLLAVLYRACQPETETEAHRLYQARKFDAARIRAYLATWRGRFNLFDPIYPFFQVVDPPVSSAPRPINRLFLDYATGIKGTLHSHIHDESQLELTPAQAARAVVTAQSFLTAGGNSGRPGLPLRHTPALQQTNFIIQGPTLFHTLWLHLFPTEAVHHLAPFFPEASPAADDCPVWEREYPEQPLRQQPQGPLDALTYPGRLIKLQPEPDHLTVRRALVTQGLWVSPNVPRFDPLAAYRLVHAENKPSVVYPFKAETGILEALQLCDPRAENLAWPVYARWRRMKERGILCPERFQFTATGVECAPGRPALVHRLYEDWWPVPAAALLDETQLATLLEYGRAVKSWSDVGTRALRAGVQTFHPSRQDRFQSMFPLLKLQFRKSAESYLPLIFSGHEAPDWEAITRALVDQHSGYLPAAAQAATRDRLNQLCNWQRKQRRETSIDE